MLVIPLMEIVAQEVDRLGLDPAAFRVFYEEALPRIYGYFLHRTGGSTSRRVDPRCDRSNPAPPFMQSLSA